MPDNLEGLECSATDIISLPVLPPTLERLAYHQGPMEHLPDILLDNLEFLNCGNTKISYIPPLPQEIETLNIADTNIQSLATLPSGLVNLDLGGPYWQQTVFSIPNSVEHFSYLGGPEINIMPELHEGLKSFNCNQGYNINYLPELPQSLEDLGIMGTNITSLPILPQGLGILDIYEVNLSHSFQTPPGLEFLYCDSNNVNWACDIPLVVLLKFKTNEQ